MGAMEISKGNRMAGLQKLPSLVSIGGVFIEAGGWMKIGGVGLNDGGWSYEGWLLRGAAVQDGRWSKLERDSMETVGVCTVVVLCTNYGRWCVAGQWSVVGQWRR
ncbi:hypothetical protein NE237_007876 [Protea cynaroides]|uniref:Uncharacterized protein n=1 Tax=Protea cynaroides TaxID=273540 RepID=A0A9Q0KQ93_9MAGN|nr:hypothetical protein NE237_007876 [Protea cynaroides]